jgi:hypothetical protein
VRYANGYVWSKEHGWQYDGDAFLIAFPTPEEEAQRDRERSLEQMSIMAHMFPGKDEYW